MIRSRVFLLLMTALLLFGPAPTRSQFGSQGNYAGPATGTNSIAITMGNVGALSELIGSDVTFVAAGNNTGLATLTVNGFTTKNIYRLVPAGLAGLGGGEILTGQIVTVRWDGTQFQLVNSARPEPPGAVIDYAGASCPSGFFAATSQTQTQAAFPALYAVLGTIWGTSGSNVVLPDLRGRATFGIDANVGGFANRITVAGGNFDGSVNAATGGGQNQTLLTTQIPAHSHTITDPGHDHPFTFSTFPFQVSNAAAVNNIAATGFASTARTASNITGITGTNNAGGGLSHPILSPSAIINKCVRA